MDTVTEGSVTEPLVDIGWCWAWPDGGFGKPHEDSVPEDTEPDPVGKVIRIYVKASELTLAGRVQ